MGGIAPIQRPGKLGRVAGCLQGNRRLIQQRQAAPHIAQFDVSPGTGRESLQGVVDMQGSWKVS